MATTNRYAGAKNPGDLTGREGAQLAREQQEKQAREAAELAAKDPGRKDAALDDQGIHPVTGRHAGGDDDLESCTERVRVSYPIEEMTFGRVVVDPGQFDEHGAMTRPPVLGPLRTFSFREGVEYMLDPQMAAHLRAQGYLYSFD